MACRPSVDYRQRIPKHPFKTARNKRTGDNRKKHPDRDAARPLGQAALEVYGREMVERVVKLGGTSGRVCLPTDWLDKMVKNSRIN